MRAASLVLYWDLDERDEEYVTKRMMELKATVDSWGECQQKLGFMFSCYCRENEGPTSFEVELFRQLMPDIPLNGMFCMRHFGWDFLLSNEEQSRVKLMRDTGVRIPLANNIAVIGFV